MAIELMRATPEQEPILANLLQLYAHDFSEFHGLDLGADARFDYKDLPLYFREPARHPFLVRKDGKWVGLVLVKRGSQISRDETVWASVLIEKDGERWRLFRFESKGPAQT